MKSLELWIQDKIEAKGKRYADAVAHGEYFRSAHAELYRYRGKNYIVHMWTNPIVGPDYVPCDCAGPPWEECIHSIRP